MDFLSYQIIDSLVDYYEVKNLENIENINPSYIEQKNLYLYKDIDSWLHPNKEIDWIIKDCNSFPLIVISQIRGFNLNKLKKRINETPSNQSLCFDFFKTLGHDSGVLIYRSDSYEKIIKSIIKIRDVSSNSYSIAGIQQVLSRNRKGKKQTFEKKLYYGINSNESDIGNSKVAVKYILKEKKDLENNIRNVVNEIKSKFEEITNDFSISNDDMKIKTFIELGHYDIELRIFGKLDYILEWLLNPKYGLVLLDSQFYKNNIFESRTIWHSFENQ